MRFTDSDAINWRAPRTLERIVTAIRREGTEKDTSFLNMLVEPLITAALIAEKYVKNNCKIIDAGVLASNKNALAKAKRWAVRRFL